MRSDRGVFPGLPQGPFQTVKEWQAALLTLPDNAYFELMRSVFGSIKTPFNKHRLIEELTALLSRPDIQRALDAYLDEHDKRIVAAAAALQEPLSEELSNFLSDEYSFMELHARLLNLEERFILYRFQRDERPHVALNPLLANLLSPCLQDTSLLFPWEPLDPTEQRERKGSPAALEERLIPAFIAFISEEREFYKTEGGIRKKTLEEGRRIFPDFDLERLTGCFQSLGLLSPQDERNIPDWGNLEIFGKLPIRERRESLAAGFYCRALGIASGAFHYTLRRFIRSLMDALDPDCGYPQKTLRRAVKLLTLQSRERLFPELQEGRSSPAHDEESFQLFMEALEFAGLLYPGELGWELRLPREAEKIGPEGCPSSPPLKPGIAMDSPFSFILFPEVSLYDSLLLASFSSIRETGTVVRFELTRDSIVRGFDFGLGADRILELLETLSGSALDQNLVWNVKDWEDRYAAVSLYQGLTLVLREDKRFLVQAEPLKSYIQRTLAPGIYLVALRDREQALSALRKAGIDIIALPGEEKPAFGDDESRGRRRETINLGYHPAHNLDVFKIGRWAQDQSPEDEIEAGEDGLAESALTAEAYQEKFQESLRKLDLPKADADELAARIARRMIFMESQLTRGTARNEKLEAKNLDYVGKMLIAKQAIAQKGAVEIFHLGPEGESLRLYGIPRALEKSGGESILAIQPLSQDAESDVPAEILRFPLGKIHLIRRIKQSIFGE